MDLFLKISFFRQIFAGPGDLEKMLCPWKERERVAGNSQFRVSEGIQKGCRYVATPCQSLCRKKLIKGPVPRAVFSVKPLTKRMDFRLNLHLLPALSALRGLYRYIITPQFIHEIQRITKSLQLFFKKKIRNSVSGKLGA